MIESGSRFGRSLLLLSAAVLGCSSDATPRVILHPVSGRILEHGKPVQGGSVRFAPVNEQAAFIVTGPVDQDGTFELKTLIGRERVAGAPEGSYQVTYSPAKLGKQALPVTPERIYPIKAGPNELAVDIGEE
jgi:hypothetical protein